METLSLIIPCRNEEEALPAFYEELNRVLSQMDCSAELLFVEDGSQDRTLPFLAELAEKDSRVKYLSLSRNFGKEAAMYAGFCNAKGDYVAVMDADLQDPPALLPEMLEILRSGEYDSVATRRKTRHGEPRLRSWFARRFYHLMNAISDSDIADGARDYRLMKREMVQAIVAMPELDRFSKGIYGWIGFRTCWLAFDNVERVAGKTKWSFFGLFRYALDGIVDFSQVPLKLALWFGMLTAFLSFVAGIICLCNASESTALLACLIGFLGGIQLMGLGLIGVYLNKVYTDVRRRPHYIISQTNLTDAERVR